MVRNQCLGAQEKAQKAGGGALKVPFGRYGEKKRKNKRIIKIKEQEILGLTTDAATHF